MKQLLLSTALIINAFMGSSQTVNVPVFGTESTLEIVTWNIENFPKNGQTTLGYVKQVIQDLDVDIFAFQEISDTISFKQMLPDLPGYGFYAKSSWYGGLVYIYKTSAIQILNKYEIYTSSLYWSSFPRAPQVLEFSFRNEDYVLINNHFKCCGDGILELNNSNDEENRRYTAANLLREYINQNFLNKKVVVVGDMNDEITDLSPNNVFQQIIGDASNFLFADMNIALGNSSMWSYPSYPSHLDHVIITNELFAAFQNSISEIKVICVDNFLNNGWTEYDTNVSDHRPVALKINPVIANTDESSDLFLELYPNPTTKTINYFSKNELSVKVFNISGKLLNSLPLRKSGTIVFSSPGIYFIQFWENKQDFVRKVVVQ